MRVDDEELYFLTGSNLAEGVTPPVDPQTTDGWRGEIRVARLRRHGLVSLDAPPLGGGNATLTTKTLRFRGARLFLNVACGAAGSLEVRVLDAGGAAVATSTSMAGTDSVRVEVAWLKASASIASLAGKPVQLVISMQQGVQLYSLRFEA